MMSAQTLRELFTKGDNERDAGLVTPEDIVRYDDIAYGADAMQVLDVYRPAQRDGEMLPVIVSVHGGGWVYGDKERYQYYCMDLARRGFAVVNFSYRLAPEHRWPAQIEDVNSAFTWTILHAQAYQIDNSHVFAVGDSAGGHLLSLYAACCTNPAYARRIGIQVPETLTLSAIGLNCGVYTVEDGKEDERMMDLFGCVTPENLHLATVTHYITEQYPPVFLMTATGDFLAEQPYVLMPVLMEKKVPFAFHYYSNRRSDLNHVFHCNMRLPEAARCNDETCEFFRKFL